MHNRLRQLVRMIKSEGVARSALKILSSLRWQYHHFIERGFDRKYGVDTYHVIHPDNVETSPQSRSDAGRHEPITVAYFEKMLQSITIAHSEFIFIDIGCGLGRALMLANKYQFRRIIGVEFDQIIHSRCMANLKRFQSQVDRAVETEAICADATVYQWPPEDSVIFLYNPFRGATFQKVIDNLTESLLAMPRRIILLYRNPVCAAVLATNPKLKLLATYPGYEIYAADHGTSA